MSASAYYHRATGKRSQRVVEDAWLLERIEDLHAANYHAYGYRRTWKALLRAGEQVGRDRVKRLMRVHGIQGAKRRGKPWRTTKPDSAARRRPDLVYRDFTTSRPDRLWVADLSYLRCWEGVVFFAFVIDAYSRRTWPSAGPEIPRSCLGFSREYESVRGRRGRQPATPKVPQTGGATMARTLTIGRRKAGAAAARAARPRAVGPRVLGPSAMGPLAIAVSAVGALAIGRVAIANAVIRRLKAEELEIGSLKVGELEVAGQRWPGTPPPSPQA